MKISVLSVGKLRPPFADDVAHYQKLLAGHVRLELIEVREDERVPRRIPDRAYVSLLTTQGETYESKAFARWMEERRRSGRDLCFVIGGPFGTHVERVDHQLSFGPHTLPYQLARVVLLEQVYRAHKILAGEPYHH